MTDAFADLMAFDEASFFPPVPAPGSLAPSSEPAAATSATAGAVAPKAPGAKAMTPLRSPQMSPRGPDEPKASPMVPATSPMTEEEIHEALMTGRSSRTPGLAEPRPGWQPEAETPPASPITPSPTDEVAEPPAASDAAVADPQPRRHRPPRGGRNKDWYNAKYNPRGWFWQTRAGQEALGFYSFWGRGRNRTLQAPEYSFKHVLDSATAPRSIMNSSRHLGHSSK